MKKINFIFLITIFFANKCFCQNTSEPVKDTAAQSNILSTIPGNNNTNPAIINSSNVPASGNVNTNSNLGTLNSNTNPNTGVIIPINSSKNTEATKPEASAPLSTEGKDAKK